MTQSKKNIVLAESSYIIRKGLLMALGKLSFKAEIKEWEEGSPLKVQILRHYPDIVIINPVLVGVGMSISPREILSLKPTTALVAITYTRLEPQYAAYFDEIISITELPESICEKLQKVIKRDPRASSAEELSEREKEILITIVKGMSNKEIADHHNLSVHTVITHRKNITRKLGIHSSAGLTVYAIINKLVNLEEIN